MNKPKSEIFDELASSIERFVHQNSDRQILNKILQHTVELFDENEWLRNENTNLRLDVVRLEVYQKFYEDNINQMNIFLRRNVHDYHQQNP